MSYATPFYYAAKAFQDPASPPATHPRPQQRRRRRIRLVLFPALRSGRRATVATATSDSSQ
jgi:hypothetical protein